MNALAEGMTRVRDEILSLRQERERLLSGVRRETRERKRAVSRMLARVLAGLDRNRPAGEGPAGSSF